MMLERTGKHLQGKEASVKESYRTKPTPCNVFLLLLSLVALFWWEETVVLVQREEKDVRTNRKTPTRKESISQKELSNKTYSLQRFSSSPLIICIILVGRNRCVCYKKLCKKLLQEP